ncbi:peroxide stress protein YaaA [Tenacibaculum sp. C7A-26P2]|uniref:peroxide stress protein YaaA n=1 Tax=Tenacibaculum sp. C7A-26P2 TaxID=3447504 RepID=UPI003F87DF63
MKIIISPTKSLDFDTKAQTEVFSQPRFLEYSKKLNKKLKTYSKSQLSELMKISDNLGALNYERNQRWNPEFTVDNAKQAVYSFTGEVFRSIDVNSLTDEGVSMLNKKVRILSGLYGILRPLDLIQPYRLEMGTKIKVDNTDNLYKFWGDLLAESLNNEMEKGDLLLNLASLEYFKAVPKKALKVPMITPIFKDFKNGDYKVIMTYAKKARGLMVRYIIDNNIETLEELKGFNVEGYAFSEPMSTNDELIFTR